MAEIRWNNIGANIGDPNSAMSNAVTGYSNVGNVFGNLRKSILDEEQRAKDNDFRQKQMDENIRQFDLRLGFDAMKHKDDQEQRGIDNQLNRDKFDESVRHNKASEGIQRAQLEISRENNRIQADMRKLQFEANQRKLQSETISRDLSAFSALNPEQRTIMLEQYKNSKDSSSQAAYAVMEEFQKNVGNGTYNNPIKLAEWQKKGQSVIGNIQQANLLAQQQQANAVKSLEMDQAIIDKRDKDLKSFNEETKGLNKKQRNDMYDNVAFINDTIKEVTGANDKGISATLFAQGIKNRLATSSNYLYEGDTSIDSGLFSGPKDLSAASSDKEYIKAIEDGLISGQFGGKLSPEEARKVISRLYYRNKNK